MYFAPRYTRWPANNSISGGAQRRPLHAGRWKYHSKLNSQESCICDSILPVCFSPTSIDIPMK
jgi:hypothetical protein